MGLEPTTLRLRVSCSTDWASQAYIFTSHNFCIVCYFFQVDFCVFFNLASVVTVHFPRIRIYPVIWHHFLLFMNLGSITYMSIIFPRIGSYITNFSGRPWWNTEIVKEGHVGRAFDKAVPFPRIGSYTFDLNYLAGHDEVVKEGHHGHFMYFLYVYAVSQN